MKQKDVQLMKILAPDIPLKELNKILKKIPYLEYDRCTDTRKPTLQSILKRRKTPEQGMYLTTTPTCIYGERIGSNHTSSSKCAQLQDLTIIKEVDIMAEYLITHQDKFATALHLVRKVLKTRKLNWKNRQNSVKKDNGMDNSTSANIPRTSTTRTITTPTNISDITTQ